MLYLKFRFFFFKNYIINLHPFPSPSLILTAPDLLPSTMGFQDSQDLL